MSTKNTTKGQSFSECLRVALEDRGLNQRYLMDKGIGDSAQISRWVTGKVTPYPKTQKAIGDVLGIEFQQLPDGSYVASDFYQQHQNTFDTVKDLQVQYGEPSLDDLAKMLEQIESFARIARDAMKRIAQREQE